MKHLLIILISLLLLSSPVIAQSEKPKTIIIPTGSIGKMNKLTKWIISQCLPGLPSIFNFVVVCWIR